MTARIHMPREAVSQEELTDEEIARLVTEAIAWDSRVHYPEVRVTVDGGIAYLSGIVDSLEEKVAVEEDACRLAGVTDMVSNLLVKPQETVTDEQIAGHVRRALSRDARIDVQYIDVNVRNGIITLSGEVVTPMEKWAALDTACHTCGAVEVVDEIVILPAEPTSDHMLTESARAQLGRIPKLDPRRIKVAVEDGVAVLRGDVDFLYQELQAERAAAEVPGIRSVRKEISVRWKRS